MDPGGVQIPNTLLLLINSASNIIRFSAESSAVMIHVDEKQFKPPPPRRAMSVCKESAKSENCPT
jgi:hypothetical protein